MQVSPQLYKWLSSLKLLPSTVRYTSSSFQLDRKTTQQLSNGILFQRLLSSLPNALPRSPLPLKQGNSTAIRTYNWNLLSPYLAQSNLPLQKSLQREIAGGSTEALLSYLTSVHDSLHPTSVPRIQLHSTRLDSINSLDDTENVLQFAVYLLVKELNLVVKQAIAALEDEGKYYAHMVVKGIKVDGVSGYQQIERMLKGFMGGVAKIKKFIQRDRQNTLAFVMTLLKPTVISKQLAVAKIGCEIVRELSGDIGNALQQIAYMGIKRHPQLANSFNVRLDDNLKSVIDNEEQYLRVVSVVLQGIQYSAQPNEYSIQQVLDSKLHLDWLDACQHSQSIFPTVCIRVSHTIWHKLQSYLGDGREEIFTRVVQVLKQSMRGSSQVSKLFALGRLFAMLNGLGEQRDPLAAILYKRIIFLMVQHHAQCEVREVILRNMGGIIAKFSTIPVEIMVRTFIKQMESAENITYRVNVFDYQFIMELAKHPTLSMKEEEDRGGVILFKFLAKQYYKSIVFSSFALRGMGILLDRFGEERIVGELIKTTVNALFNTYPISNQKQNNYQKQLSHKLLKTFIKMNQKDVSQNIKKKATEMYLNGTVAFKNIIQMFGNVDEICYVFKKEQSKELELLKGIKEKEQKIIMRNKQEQNLKINKKKISKETIQEKKQAYQPKMEYTINPKVIEDINKFKELKFQQRLRLNKLQQKHQPQLKKIVYKTMLQEPTLEPFDSVKGQFPLQIASPQSHQYEDRDIISMKTTVKQYKKQIQSLFRKYAISHSNQISFSQISKMLFQKNISIPKFSLNEIFFSINRQDASRRNILGTILLQKFPLFLTLMSEKLTFKSADQPLGVRLQSILLPMLTNELFYKPRQECLLQSDVPQNQRRQVFEQTSIDYTFHLQDQTNIGQQFLLCFQILDGIVADAMGVHVVSGIAKTETKYMLVRRLREILPSKRNYSHNAVNKAEEGVSIQNNYQSQRRRNNKTIENEKIRIRSRSRNNINYQKNSNQSTQKKRLEHAASLRLQLNKMKEEKMKKIEEENNKIREIKELQNKKEEFRKKYLQENRKKLMIAKEKEKIMEEEKQMAAKKQKQKAKIDSKKNQANLLEKQIKQIKQKLEFKKQKKNQQKKQSNVLLKAQKNKKQKIIKSIQNSPQKQIQNKQQLTKYPIKQQALKQNSKKIKKSIQNGAIFNILNKYESQLTILFQTYWKWENKSIDLKGIARIFKDFSVKINPKILSQTFKSQGKAQKNYLQFKQFLAKCVSKNQQSQELENLFSQLRMNERYYKQLVLQVKSN